MQIDAQTVEESYTADLQNDKHDRTNVEAGIFSVPASVEIIKGNLNFGNVPAGMKNISSDLFTLRHSPQIAITLNDLDWNVTSHPVPPDIFPQVGGIAMPGNPNQLAIDAYLDYEDAGRPQDSDISFDANNSPILRTVIDVEINLNVTVADINNLLSTVNGKIVEMTEDNNWLGILIPDPGGLDALNAIVTSLKQSPAVDEALPRYLPVEKQLLLSIRLSPADATHPDFMTQPEIAHHLAVKGAAAWNARAALDYPTSCIPFLVLEDNFGLGLSYNGLANNFDNIFFDILNPATVDGIHFSGNSGNGYHVAGILAGKFTDTAGPYVPRERVTGMFPGWSKGSSRLPTIIIDHYSLFHKSPNLDISNAIKDIYKGNYDKTTPYKLTCNGNPTQYRTVIINRSWGVNPDDSVSYDHALHWAKQIRGITMLPNKKLEERFSLFAAAGNEFGLPANHAGGIQRIGLEYILDRKTGKTIPKFTNTLVVENRPAINMGNVYAPRQWLHLSSNVGGNISAIGALGDTTPRPPPAILGLKEDFGVNGYYLQSNLCNYPGNGPKVPVGIYSFTGPQFILKVGCREGTSMATPQVAGLAAYLQALRPTLNSTELINHIINNAENNVRDDPDTLGNSQKILPTNFHQNSP